MKDAFGIKLEVGDYVLHGRCSNSSVAYQRGLIALFAKTWQGREYCKIKWDGEDKVSSRAGQVLGKTLVLLTTKEEQE
jgi:hypothetical protein